MKEQKEQVQNQEQENKEIDWKAEYQKVNDKLSQIMKENDKAFLERNELTNKIAELESTNIRIQEENKHYKSKFETESSQSDDESGKIDSEKDQVSDDELKEITSGLLI